MLPRSVIVINWLLALLAIGGIRIVARFILSENVKFSIFNYEFKSRTENVDNKKSRVLIYGAGNAGVQLCMALNNTNQLHPVGFIDDNKELQDNTISGLKVFSQNDIENLINKLKVDEVLIAIPSASRSDRFRIIDKLERHPVIVRTLPGLTDLAQGKVKIDDLLQVSIKDLLGRKSVEPNELLLGKNITNKTVVVTGAGGSIGSELCRQIIFLKPKVCNAVLPVINVLPEPGPPARNIALKIAGSLGPSSKYVLKSIIGKPHLEYHLHKQCLFQRIGVILQISFYLHFEFSLMPF